MSTTALPVTNATKLGTVKLCAAAKTDVGRRRSENQDSYGYAHTASASLFIVADGMGGARGGGTASAMAVNIVMDGAVTDTGQMSADALSGAISLANKVIYSRSQVESQLSGMGTTIVALAFVDDVTVVAHVGDSRIYSWRRGELHQLTRDHTLVQELVDTGAIAPQDAANHPIAHMLTRSLGPAESTQPEVNILPQPARPGDKFLLCSDGLYNHVSNEEIGEILASHSPKESVDILVQMALDGGGSDNVTIQVVEVLNVSDESVHVTRPADGTAEKFISSEIDVQEFSGVTLSDFTRSVRPGTTEAPVSDEAVSQEELAPETPEIAVNGAASPDREEEKSLADELLVDESEALEQAEYPEASTVAPEYISEHKATPYQFVILVVAALSASFFALWLFVVLGPKKAVVTPQTSVAAKSSLSSETAQMTEDVLNWNPTENVSSAASSSSQFALVIPDESAASSASSAEVVTPPTEASSAASALPENSSIDTTEPADDAASALANQQRLAAQTSSLAQVAGITGEPSSLPETTSGTQTIPETSTKVLTPAMTRFANILVWAGDIRVPTVPQLSLGGAAGKDAVPDEPIVWEQEKQLVQKLMNEQQSAASAGAPPALQTPEEIADLCEKKEQSRIRVFDVDTKLELLLVENKEQAKKKQARLEMEGSRLEEVRRALEEDLKDAQKRAATWEDLQKKVAASDPLKIADEVALVADAVQAKRSEYSEATEKYLKTVDEWQGNPKDTELAAKMAALGRGVKEKRVELETAVGEAVNGGKKIATEQVEDLRFYLGSLKLRQDQMNRQIGLVRAFAATSVERRRETQRKLLEERRVQIETLNQLQKALSDEAEVSFRRKNSQLFYSPAA